MKAQCPCVVLCQFLNLRPKCLQQVSASPANRQTNIAALRPLHLSCIRALPFPYSMFATLKVLVEIQQNFYLLFTFVNSDRLPALASLASSPLRRLVHHRNLKQTCCQLILQSLQPIILLSLAISLKTCSIGPHTGIDREGAQ